jgi:hypothetical protein
MIVLNVPSKNELQTGEGLNVIDKMINDKKHVFILIYMDGCGPCNATRPEWQKMTSTLKTQYANNKDIAIIDMNKDVLPLVKRIGSVEGFPTMKYITNQGKTIEAYEDSGIKNKNRSVDSFTNWIESKVLKGKSLSIKPESSPQHLYNRLNKSKSKSKTKGKGRSRSKKGKSRRHRK